MPAKPARGEADLIAHLKSVRGGVPTLKLPPVESADPIDLARQIRSILTGMPAAGAAVAAPVPDATSPHLLAAATAAVNWIRKRRAEWIAEQDVDVSPEPAAQSTEVPALTSDESYEPYEPIEADDRHTPDDPYATHAPPTIATRATGAGGATQMKAWLPRAAALAIVIGVAGGVASY